MKSKLGKSFWALIAAVLALSAFGGDAHKGGAGINRPRMINDFTFLDGNTINCTINSDGTYADDLLTGMAGLEWPIGSGKTAVFTAGIRIAGIHRPSDSIRTASMDYQSEYQPGPLLETFNTETNSDNLPVSRAADPRYRSYKIGTKGLRSEDYLQWPGDLGAPFVDINGNGQWDPGIDKPKLVGDQQVWMVINDVNRSLHRAMGTTPPMGLEVRCLYYVYDQPGALGNTLFLKWEIINRSDADYDSVYLSLWSDIDLGDANDDLPGCDSLLSLGYVYNGHDSDVSLHGYGNTPPADGFLYLEGPTVPGAPGDSALVEGTWKHGLRNLPMTAFAIFAHGTYQALNDPSAGNPQYAGSLYDFMKGKSGYFHTPVYSAVTGQPMVYWFSGDPVAGTGDLPANFTLGTFHPQDVEILPTSGPFSLAHGDTQHVLGAFLIAQGTDRLNSVTLLKQYTSEIRSTYRTVQPKASVYVPQSVSFGRRDIAGPPDTLDCAVVNSSSDTVDVTGFTLNGGAPFALVNPSPLPQHVAPGGTFVQRVSFSPIVRGNYQDSILVQTNNLLLSSAEVQLSGYGYLIGTAIAGQMYASANGAFLNVNTYSGAATPVSYKCPPGCASLSIRRSTRELYAFAWPTLYRVDVVTGDVVQVCTFNVPGVNTIAFSPSDELFGGTTGGSLYRLFPDTGDTLYVGKSSTRGFNGLAFSPGGTLWASFQATSGRDDQLYRISTTTAAATFVGFTGDSTVTAGLAFGPDGTLFGVKGTQSQINTLIRIDTVSGAGSVVGSMGRSTIGYLAMRTDSLSSGVGDGGTMELPREFALQQNYPNPFNPTTTIQFDVPVETFYKTSLQVYDILGREVATLFNEVKQPGRYTVTWDASRFASGMYLVRMTAGKFTATRKILLLR